MKVSVRHSQQLVRSLSSSRFFWCIVGLFVVEALWIALTGRYPMAFDEGFHLGIIRLYAHHLSPFWNSQPLSADSYGPIIHDPSYLYQYLMSFPYRLVSVFTNSQVLHVLVLRFISIGLFASGLPLYRRLLSKTGASAALVNSCLLIFVVLPVVPLLAAQINYDNLLFPLVGLSLLLTLAVGDDLVRRRVNVVRLMQLAIVCLLTSLVTYPFLPVFLAIIAYLIVRLWQGFPTVAKAWQGLRRGVSVTSGRSQLLYAIALIVALGLFGQRYGVNMVRYHKPVPGCAQVLSVSRCASYGPWIRDYNYAVANTNGPVSPLVFSADWFYGMWLRTFFAVDGPHTDYETRGPLLLPGVGAIVLAGLGLLVSIRYGRRVFRRSQASALWLLLLTSAFYVGVLWLDEYSAYIRTGQPVAINGRYLVPVFLPLLLLVALAFREWLAQRPHFRLTTITVVLVTLLWGGGALTYILRANNDWYWPNHTVLDANHILQNLVGPLTPGNGHPTEFLH